MENNPNNSAKQELHVIGDEVIVSDKTKFIIILL